MEVKTPRASFTSPCRVQVLPRILAQVCAIFFREKQSEGLQCHTETVVRVAHRVRSIFLSFCKGAHQRKSDAPSGLAAEDSGYAQAAGTVPRPSVEMIRHRSRLPRFRPPPPHRTPRPPLLLH